MGRAFFGGTLGFDEVYACRTTCHSFHDLLMNA
jgi:hypothetical protein